MTVFKRNTQDLYLGSTALSKVVSLGGHGSAQIKRSPKPLLESTLTSCGKKKTTNPPQSSNFILIYIVHVYVCVQAYIYVSVSCSVMSHSETQWTVAHQAPLPMELSRQEYWSGLPFPSPGDLLDLGIELRSPASQADSLLSEPPGKPIETPPNILSHRSALGKCLS